MKSADYQYNESIDGTLLIYGYTGTDLEIVITYRINYIVVSTTGTSVIKNNKIIKKILLSKDIIKVEDEESINCESLTDMEEYYNEI